MTANEPFGWSGSQGWTVLNAGVDPNAEQRVSVHEQFHHRLDRSTNFGALLLMLDALVQQGMLDAAVLRPLRDQCRTVHEAAASYLTDLVLGGAVVSRSDPDQRYRNAMASVVGEDLSAWCRFHSALALARACLQPNVVAVARANGLLSVTASTIDSTVRPDDRFRRLRRSPPDFENAASDAAHDAGVAQFHPIMSSPTLDAQWFAPAQQPLWATFHQHMYTAASTRLTELGCPTAPNDDNLKTSATLLAMTRHYVDDIGLRAAPQGSDEANVWSAAVAVDSETPTLPTRRTAATCNYETNVHTAEIAAGVGEHEHLHIAVRPIESYLTFEWIGRQPKGPVTLRRSLDTASGRVVEHLDLSNVDPDDLLREVGIRVIATVSESQLTRPDFQPWWPLVRSNAYLLSDVPLLGRIRPWIDGSRCFRYRFLSVTASGAAIAVMVARFEVDADHHSHLIIRPLVSNTVGVLRQVFAEVDPDAVFAIEDNLLGVDDLGLGLALFHIVGEDSTFGVRPQGHQ